MNCTEAGPTQHNPRVTDKVPAHTLQNANCSHVDIPKLSLYAMLPGERTSSTCGDIRLSPLFLLSSHHAPKKSISKPEISSSQHSSTHSMPFIILIRYFNAYLIIYLHLNLTGRQRPMVGRQRPMAGRQRAMTGRQRAKAGCQRAMAERQKAMAGRQRAIQKPDH